MTRSTVDFGIDLGTTNSSIAVLRGSEQEVIKNNDSSEITPSAVAIRKDGSLVVGRLAKGHSGENPDGYWNTFFEFKQQMGSDAKYQFKRSGRWATPEELSAEVLKSLKNDVIKNKRETLGSAVITVPAAFELPQCEATRRAAELAGITFSPLLQEPVAAALAYGFQTESERVLWLAYDFGGGTFDAAVIQVREGVIQVVNHSGDNQLGGKLIDRAIIDQLLVPTIIRQFSVTDFSRDNAKWKSAFAKLKLHAEDAKIQLSANPKAPLFIENLCKDDNGEPIDFDYSLKREDVERLAEPFIVRSINICKKVLTEKRLAVDHIEKVLLVGGPTLMPYLRERLLDSKEGLGLPLDFSIDPLTVVARGAAVFAGSQRIDRVTIRSAAPGTFALDLEYKPVGDDPEPQIGGRVLSPNGDVLSGATIEFVNPENRWRSGKISLMENGGFVTNLWAEKGKPNTFEIELRDSFGKKLDTIPERVTYTIGLSITDPPLTHNVGVGLANNTVSLFFEKGTPLPARTIKIHKQAYIVHRGRKDEALKIPVVEGENKRADRNKLIGDLEITGDKLKRDVPTGSEIEITIELDQSRIMKVSAYIPILDEIFENVSKLIETTPDVGVLLKSADREKNRLSKLREKINPLEDKTADQVLARLQDENIVEDVETTLSVAETDQAAAQECQKRLLDLRIALDEAEDAVEVPALLKEARQLIIWVNEDVENFGKDEDQRLFREMSQDLETAIAARTPDPDAIRRKMDQMSGLRYRLLAEQPDWWVGYFEFLKDSAEKMSDPMQADLLFAQCHRSISNNDLDGLKSAVRQLTNLLPEEEQDSERGYGSTIFG